MWLFDQATMTHFPFYEIKDMDEGENMSNQMSYRKLVRMWRLPVFIIFLCFLMNGLTSCGHETVFPDRPETHRLINEMREWPDEYYWLVATGVSSQLMAMPSATGLLSRIEERWSNVKKLETAEDLITYFNENDLRAISEAIEKTLSQNRAAEPTGDSHKKLQADAIKRGLANAAWEVKG